ncbi:MAG: alpha/beta hydrolase [Rhodocyclaceae bacterium]|nr:alpha/beta hydrolase [Rhodocyclaceae bacterium]
MSNSSANHFTLGDDLRGVSRLAIDATVGVTRLVEHLTANILNAPAVLGTPTHRPPAGLFGMVCQSVCGITHGVGGGLDLALSRLTPLLPAIETGEQREMFVAILNGVLGHHLVATHNPLATPMQLRHDGHALPVTKQALARTVPKASGKLLVCIHGLCMNDLQWQQGGSKGGHDHGQVLARAGYTPLYLRYNTGEHVSLNGRAFAAQLEALVAAWPVPVESIVLLGHSMGGLVSRSACHYGQAAGHDWLRVLKKLIFLGTPHHGSPLERGGNIIDRVLGSSPYTFAFSRLGKIRSAGITDLRHGSVLDDDWVELDRFAYHKGPGHCLPLPAGVACYAVGATLAKHGPVSAAVGDGLVPLYSALGKHRNSARALGIPAERRYVAYGTGHIALLYSQPVCRQLEQWLAEESGA